MTFTLSFCVSWATDQFLLWCSTTWEIIMFWLVHP
jgi:hypothetical protein